MDSYGTRSLREIVRILFSHWFMMLFILVLGGAGTWYVCEFWAAKKYRSQVSLIFKRPVNKSPLSSDVAGERALEVFVKAQQQILMSDLVMARAKVISEDNKLRDKWRKELRPKWEKGRHEEGTGLTEAQIAIAEFLTKGEVEKRVQVLMNKNQQDMIDFRKSVKLETPGGEQVGMTETFQISVDRPAPPENAFYAADLVADMYIARYQELQRLQNEPALRVMDDVLANFNEDFDRRRKAYEDFIAENVQDITGLEQLLKSGTEQGLQIILSEIRKSDALLGMELVKDQANFDAIKKVLPENAFEAGFIATQQDDTVGGLVDAISTEFMKEDVAFVELTKSLASLETKRARIESQFLEESRDYQYMREQVAKVKRQMLGEVIAHVRGLQLRIASRQQQKARNEELVHKVEKDQNKVQLKLAQYSRLKNDFEVAQKQLEKLQQDRIDAMTGQLSAREAVTINKLDQASMPDPARPIVPLTIVYTIVACAVSILLGVTLAFMADHFDHTLRSGVDAERYLGIPVLGSVKRRGRRLVVAT